MSETKKVFVTVKTYPHPSNKYGELVCTAGIDETGNLIRLYPLRYRLLTGEDQFSKYQWIEVEVLKNSKDNRPESYRAVQSTLKALEAITDAKIRRDLVLKNRPLETMCQLTKTTSRVNQSLAIVRPLKVKNFTAEADSPEWTLEQQEALRQKLLWDEGHVPRLEKIPYKFYYHYTCQEPGCKGHQQSIYDWELHVLYLKMRDKFQDEKIALEKVKQKYFDQMCDPKFDLHFFVGTHNRHPAWIILGTFWPPNPFPPEQKGQLTLWSLGES